VRNVTAALAQMTLDVNTLVDAHATTANAAAAGTAASGWSKTHCNVCGKSFGMFRRMHHCRKWYAFKSLNDA